MNNCIEIELRYEVLDSQQLPAFCASLQKLQTKRDIDIYFDTPSVELYQKGIFIRLRNKKKLEIKFNRACLENPDLAIQDYCEEHSFDVPIAIENRRRMNNLLMSLNLRPACCPNIKEMKEANGFIEHYVVDKVRTSYKYKSFTISIDEVAHLGLFLEIELMAPSTDDLEKVKKEMEQLLASLALTPLKTGYGTLLLRKKDFQQYLLGRFILQEDRKYVSGVK